MDEHLLAAWLTCRGLWIDRHHEARPPLWIVTTR
jgi:hypothetical protein